MIVKKMVFFCGDLIGHSFESKDTFFARLAEYMAGGWAGRGEPLSYI